MVKLPDATILGARPSPRVAERTPDTRMIRSAYAADAEARAAPMEALARSFEGVSDVMAQAAQRNQNRLDTVGLAKAEIDFETRAANELRRLQDEDDLSDPEKVRAYQEFLSGERSRVMSGFRGSGDARAVLDARLYGQFGKYSDSAGRLSVETGKSYIRQNVEGFISSASKSIHDNPGAFGGAMNALEDAIEKMAPGLNPQEELEMRITAQRQLAASAFNALMARDDIEGARRVIEDTPGLEKILTPAERDGAMARVSSAVRERNAGALGAQKKLDELRTLLGRDPTMAERRQLAGFGDGDTISGFSTDVRSVRQEFNRASDEFIDVKSRYQRIQVTGDSPAGDLSLIFAYMKMLDPGSVVREGEQATARNAAAIPDRIRNLYNRVMSGEPLTPEQRTDFRSQAAALLKPEIRNQIDRETHYRDLASRAGLNPDDVVLDHIGELRGDGGSGATAPEAPAPGRRTLKATDFLD